MTSENIKKIHAILKNNKIDFLRPLADSYTHNELDILAEKFGISFTSPEQTDYKKNKVQVILDRGKPEHVLEFITRACKRGNDCANNLTKTLKTYGINFSEGHIIYEGNIPIEDFTKLQSEIENKLINLDASLGLEYKKLNKIKAEHDSIRGLRVILEGIVNKGLEKKSVELPTSFRDKLDLFSKEYTLDIVANSRTGNKIMPEGLYYYWELLSEIESHYSEYSPELINYTYYVATVFFWYILQKIH